MINCQHSVTVKHIERWWDISQWLKDNCQGMYSKDISYPVSLKDWESVTMNFENEQDAVMFKLRWG